MIYTYDGAHDVLSRTDAKGQVTGYSYDVYGRLTPVAHYPTGITNGADPAQQVNYYDTNPYNDPIANNTWGRLAAVAFGSACPGGGTSATVGYVYMYGYNPAGRVTGQKMRVNLNQSGSSTYTCGPPFSKKRMISLYSDQTGDIRFGIASHPANRQSPILHVSR